MNLLKNVNLKLVRARDKADFNENGSRAKVTGERWLHDPLTSAIQALKEGSGRRQPKKSDDIKTVEANTLKRK